VMSNAQILADIARQALKAGFDDITRFFGF
jgi:hypothetical protein